jgi:hypothetical protein
LAVKVKGIFFVKYFFIPCLKYFFIPCLKYFFIPCLPLYNTFLFLASLSSIALYGGEGWGEEVAFNIALALCYVLKQTQYLKALLSP